MNALKTRWKDCEIIAGKLGITKHQVYNFLYQNIKERGWVEQAKNGDELILEEIKKLPSWTQMLQDVPLTVVREDEEENRGRYRRSDKVVAPTDKLRLAMWFIEKFITPEEALEAVKLGVNAVNTLK